MVIQGNLIKPPDPLLWNNRIERWCASIDDTTRELPLLIETVRSSGGSIADLKVQKANLSEVFISLTGRELRE